MVMTMATAFVPPRYLLDTNICIYIIKKKPLQVFEYFRTKSSGEIAISSITGAELAYGVSKSESGKNQFLLNKFLSPLEIMPFDDTAMWHYGEIRAILEMQGRPIGPLDTLIAAHARALNCTLVTNNTREFERVPGLLLENWVADQ